MTPSLVIAVPSVSGFVSGWTTQSIANLAAPPEYLERLRELASASETEQVGRSPSTDALIAHAKKALPFHLDETWCDPFSLTTCRSRAVKRFLHHTKASHLLFVDADVAFELAAIRGMLAENVTCIGTPYPKRDFRIENMAQAIRDGKDPTLASLEYTYRTAAQKVSADATRIEVQGLGLGCTLLRRDLLQRMWDTWKDGAESKGERLISFDYHPTYRGPTVLLFSEQWGERDGHRVQFGEDESFFNRVRLFDRIWMFVGPGSPAAHVGEYIYQGSPETLRAFMTR